jgi:hypothetical protein
MKKSFTITIFFLLFSFIGGEAHSTEASYFDYAPLPTLVVPNIYTGTAATSTFNGPIATAERTYQWLINENQLTSLTGQYLDAIALRLPTSATSTWPAIDTTFTSYDIYLSESVAPANRSFTFSQNVVGIQKQVRSGVLHIAAGSYTNGSNPNAFGPDILFDSSYLYTGGHLLIELRHTGFNGTGRSNEGAGTSSTGYGTDISACWTGSYTGTSGVQGNFSIIRLTSTITGIQSITGTPNEFKLNQNYPNPFNPSTSISFEIPSPSFVKLTIYDALGRDVSTLVNEKLNAGSYEWDWNAGNLTSGMYYYTLKAGDFVETK